MTVSKDSCVFRVESKSKKTTGGIGTVYRTGYVGKGILARPTVLPYYAGYGNRYGGTDKITPEYR